MLQVPPNSLILVTGANGYVASVLIQTLLQAGYRVRGTVRSPDKHQWMLAHYGANFSLVSIPDISDTADGLLAAAVAGVIAIAHVATAIPANPDPHAFIPRNVNAAMNVLEAAAKEPSVKSVVYTSSRTACTHHVPGQSYTQTPDTWNTYALREAWAQPIDGPLMARMMLNYEAAKTESEQKMFTWVQERKPSFTFNSVIPCCVIGTVPCWRWTGFSSSASLFKMLWQGNASVAYMVPPEWFVDSEDTALLHLAALTLPDVNGERLMAAKQRFTWNQVLDLFQKFVPAERAASLLRRIDEPDEDRGHVDFARGEEVLKRVKNGKGFETLESSMEKFVKSMLEAEAAGDKLVESNGDKVMATINQS